MRYVTCVAMLLILFVVITSARIVLVILTYYMIVQWCRRGDSDPHGIAPTAP